MEIFPELTDEAREMLAAETTPLALSTFRAKLAELPENDFTVENIFPLFKATQKETGVKGKMLWMPISYCSFRFNAWSRITRNNCTSWKRKSIGSFGRCFK